MLYAGQVEQVTLQQERGRMALELNDTIGHTYTTVAVGLDAVICLIESMPEQAKQKLDALRGVTATASKKCGATFTRSRRTRRICRSRSICADRA